MPAGLWRDARRARTLTAVNLIEPPAADKPEAPAPAPHAPRIARPLRQSSGTAWAWQDKAALRRIREAFDASNDVSSALAAYVALTEIASNEQRDEFTTTHAWIARTSGLSVRTVQSRIKVLAEIGLVEVITPALRAPSTYRLLALGNGCGTSGNGCRAFGNGQKQASLPTLEESQEESVEESKKARGSPRFTPPTDSELALEAGKQGLPGPEADKFLAHYRSNGWRVGRGPMKDWRAALTGWKLRWEESRPITKGSTHAPQLKPNPRNAGTY